MSSGLIYLDGDDRQVGSMINGMGSALVKDRYTDDAGTRFTDDDIRSSKRVVMINSFLAKVLDSAQASSALIGKQLNVKGNNLSIVAVVNDGGTEPRIAIPITLLSKSDLQAAPPQVVVEAVDVLDVQPLKTDIIAWLEETFEVNDGFTVGTNDARIAQAEQGFLLFRIIMGLIVGISVVVGGIGIMNVLLISITERTVEIGIRKAVGANRRDIVFQFLAESITVSAFGSLVGLALGVSITAIAVPVVSSITEIPFYAIYTWNTLVVTGVLALVLGITFGTYPAMRAARLDPVDAIRRE